nr:hypothetical protein [Tanacetum cinerariifolium]
MAKDQRSQSMKEQAYNEAAKFVRGVKSFAIEGDESLAKHKALELEIERLLRAVVSQDIMFVVQKAFVVDTSNLQIELERTKECFKNCIIKKENEYAKLWNDCVNSSAGVTHQLSSRDSFALVVGKCTSSGNAFSLTVGKCTSSRIFITSSGNDLEYFIPNNPLLNLMLHLQSSLDKMVLSAAPVLGVLSKTYPSWEESRLEQEGEHHLSCLQALEHHALFSELELDMTMIVNSAKLKCYSSLDQSFSQALIPLVEFVKLLRSFANSLAGATHQLSSGNSFALAVGKYTSSGNSAVGMLFH